MSTIPLNSGGADSAPSALPDDSAQVKTRVLDELVSREVTAMAVAWKSGGRPLAEEFLSRHPNLHDEDAIRIVYEEACLRLEAGEESVSAEIVKRFPQWRSKLELLFDGNRLLRTATETDFPKIGEELGDFRLLAEIGRGAVGRTYLARQCSLAERLVVLKVAALGHDEHLSLGRLQHMYIVPLYFEQVIHERNIRVMCMPNLGGTTLGRILETLSSIPMGQRTGRHILEALDRRTLPVASDEPPGGPYRKYLAQATYVEAVCWMAACLADALQYAHDHGLIHMDVKPSNVLVAADGQPMLLDFHLARGPLERGHAKGGRLGGTPRFMSPEQREAMSAVRQGLTIATAIDGRTDIYSLGLILHQALGGEVDPGFPSSTRSGKGGAGTRTAHGRDIAKDRHSGRTPLEQSNPRVSPGLGDIVRKCLADDPESRFRDAGALAIDLRRHLNDLPLRGVPNRSLIERWRKWRRRKPLALARGLFRLAVAAAFLAVVGFWITRSGQRIHEIDAAMVEGRELLRNKHFAEAERAFNRGLVLAARLPLHDGRKRVLTQEIQQVRGAKAAAALHDLVDLLRFRSGVTPPSPDEARSLFLRGQELWKLRGRLARPGRVPSDDATEQQIRLDLLDLATICANLRVQGEPPSRVDPAVRDAVQILLDAARQYGSSPALSRDLRRYAQKAGMTDLALPEVEAPRTAWDHYDLGRSYLRSEEFGRAHAEFQRSVELQPGEFWPNFYEGVAAYHLGHHQQAVAALSICVALAPTTAECYYNRGVALEASGQNDRALSDYEKARTFNPGFLDAALNRGLLLFRLKRFAAAERAFELALKIAPTGVARGRVHYNLALVHLAQNAVSTARADLRNAIANGYDQASALLARLDSR